MMSIRAPLHRIPCVRILRPPSTLPTRIFSTRASPYQGYRNGFRAQLPFLSGTHTFRSGLLPFRSISTESRAWRKQQLMRTLYYSLVLLVLGAGAIVGYWALKQDWLERLYPSPNEWGFFAKMNWREAHEDWEKEKEGYDLTNWAGVGAQLTRVIQYCEMKESVLNMNSEPDITVPGFDRELIERDPRAPVNNFTRIGMDVSDKPEHWRRAYFQALMGYARATEMNAGWVLDTTRGLSFPGNQVIGPSNPNPHPPWPGSPPAPLEKNCVPCFDEPNIIFIRILTTKGFTPRQRLDVALAYASWADFNGDKDIALQLHKWSLDLACTALADEGNDPNNIVDRSTGVIKLTAPFVTTNILKATTALAFFHARNAGLSSALNIYIAVLRARRSAPDAPMERQYQKLGADLSLQSFDSITRYVKSLFSKPKMAPEPPSGNEPFLRTQGSNCDEAGVMVHVGEILFAKSSMREGLSWTRDSVALAERGIMDRWLDNDSKRACTDCMSAGLDNWHQMMGVLVEEEKIRKQKTETGKSYSTGWSAWVPSFAKSEVATLVDEGDWEKEAEMVAKKRAMFMEHRLMMSMNRKPRPIL